MQKTVLLQNKFLVTPSLLAGAPPPRKRFKPLNTPFGTSLGLFSGVFPTFSLFNYPLPLRPEGVPRAPESALINTAALLLKTVKEGRPVDGVPFSSAPVFLSGAGNAVLERCFRRVPPSFGFVRLTAREGIVKKGKLRGRTMRCPTPRRRTPAWFAVFV
jgi:hypothetical protein